MSFTIVAIIAGVLLVGITMVLLFSSLKLKNLRTIPKPREFEVETFKMFSAEARAGVKLQQACYNNDPKAASEALTMWAWASGDSTMVNSLDQKREALKKPAFRKAVTDLWAHLESKGNRTWFGDALWNAFLETNPEFYNLEITG